MQALLQAIRRGCSPAIWSKAVELARQSSVIALAERKGEVELRVATDGGLKSATVTLYPDDEEWTCDCDSTADACVHVAAAAIALNRARAEGRSLVAVGLAHVGYRLTTVSSTTVSSTTVGGSPLSFDRVLGDSPLAGSLTEASRDGAKFAATQADMTVEVLLGTRPRGALIREHWQKLWPALSECEDVTVDGARVKLGAAQALQTLVVEDAGDGFSLRLAPLAGLERTWLNGLALRDSTLFVAQALPAEIEALAQGRKVSRDEVPAFVTDVLPHLRELVDVQVRTKRLPETVDMAPSVAWDVAPQGAGLSVMATLVYGEHARIDGDRLKWLSGPLPKRRPLEEQRLRERVGWKLGERKFVTPDEAPEVLAMVARQSGKKLLSQGGWEAKSEGGTLQLSLRTGTETVSHDMLTRALRSGQSLIGLSDGSFVPVPMSLRNLELVSRLLHGKAALSPSERVDAARLLREIDVPLPPDLAELALLLDGGVPTAVLPADLTATLRDYQQQGVDWLVFMRRARLGALLADDMGLGKTVQTIASLPSGGAHLIVAPTSVLSVWERELSRFRPALSVHRYHGAARKLVAADVVLTTYGTLRQDQLTAREWTTVILDEAQAIKNADSQTARACFALRAQHRVALTGTPVENSLDELWSIFHFLNPGYLGRREDMNVSGIGKRVRPFVLRRTKEKVARDLPARTDNVLVCELSDEERQIYQAMHAATVPSVLAALEQKNDVLSALEALLRLRQAASHPRLLPGYADWAGTSAKLGALTASLQTLVAEGHKALVFSQWTGFLDIVQAQLSMPFCRLDGSTTDRAGVVARFEDPSGPPVMLISLKAGGTGLTLTSADYVFLLDPWWNPAVEEQAAARAHRIGQTKPVFVYRLIAKDTVEERLLALQAEKRALFDAVLGDEALSKRLTRDDLRGLLS